MTAPVLETRKITKTYQDVHALEDVSISLERGKIYGLIGQNGAGKTTLMRLIAGLSFPTSGELLLFDESSQQALQKNRQRMGCMIENPSILGNMNAKDNLHVHKQMKGLKERNLEQKVLEIVGLSHTGKKKAKDFSLGMRQRLGIAITLLGNPEILLLDEPINGLDPSGIAEIRQLIRQLADEHQMTILLSSHHLAELHQTADQFIIVNKGKVLKTLRHSELEAQIDKHIILDCAEPERLQTVLKEALHTDNFIVQPDKSIKLYDFIDQKEVLSKALIDHGIVITTFATQEDTLENYYLRLIGGSQ
ncbi:ATP-binding cassette domain-containing protein [Gracilibacillus alcaliphilus]|uniref:ATP-binding cassette domain-containing protein n=1 Tax=Gracilibacillus alcaliphilus TaxID=1401441 RepID=UPI0019562407|nr:ATP-binding cassette domain-containing protein [Gracilibacillus alcaliphilus]MBM7675313.1 ABC-2 type transport system ATP-binding protein [Gracilibacillus alcaliphilus]